MLGSFAGIVMNTSVILPAIFLGHAIDTALAYRSGAATESDLTWAALGFAGGTALVEGPRIFKRWFMITANARIRANLRADALRGVLSWPMARVHQAPIGDLMARIIGDVEVIGVGTRELTIETWDTLLFSTSLVIALIVIDAPLALVALAPVPISMLLAHATGRWVGRRTARAREANASMTAVLQEQLTGLRLLRLFGRGSAAVRQFADVSSRFAASNLATQRLGLGLTAFYSVLICSGVIWIIWRGGEEVIAGSSTVGVLVAFTELYLRFVNRGFRVPRLFNSLQSAGAAYARLRPLLAPALSGSGEARFASFDARSVAGMAEPLVLPAARSPGPVAVSLRHVSFSYPGSAPDALHDLSLEIPAGALVAVTGPIGSGKSALARAVLGLYPISSGEIRLDGHSVAHLPSLDRAAQVGYLAQDPFVFSGTVRENVLLRPRDDESDDAVTDRTIAMAALEDDIRSLPEGLETEIGELGIRVSGGQRQRIGLARALNASGQRPGLLVLDDPFSAIDVETEATIVEALRTSFGPTAPPEHQATILLCSHRLAAFPLADRVVVLDAGRIVETGTHTELLAADGLYARIYRAQRQVEQPAMATPA